MVTPVTATSSSSTTTTSKVNYTGMSMDVDEQKQWWQLEEVLPLKIHADKAKK